MYRVFVVSRASSPLASLLSVGCSSTDLRKGMRSWYPVPKRIVIVVFAGVSKLLPSIKLIEVDVKFAIRGF